MAAVPKRGLPPVAIAVALSLIVGTASLEPTSFYGRLTVIIVTGLPVKRFCICFWQHVSPSPSQSAARVHGQLTARSLIREGRGRGPVP